MDSHLQNAELNVTCRLGIDPVISIEIVAMFCKSQLLPCEDEGGKGMWWILLISLNHIL